MPRPSVIATFWKNAWGTAGTRYMKPSPHIEGLGSYAEKLDDRMCFLAFQQTDIVFSEDMNNQYNLPSGQFIVLDRYALYYSGWHPQLLFGFRHYWTGNPATPASGTYSVRFGNVDFGTVTVRSVDAQGGSTVDWYIDIPDSFTAGEYVFAFFGASGDGLWYEIEAAAGAHISFLPTRLF